MQVVGEKYESADWWAVEWTESVGAVDRVGGRDQIEIRELTINEIDICSPVTVDK